MVNEQALDFSVRRSSDSETCSPTSGSLSSSTASMDDSNLVLDMSAGKSRSINSSDEENREPAAKKLRLMGKKPVNQPENYMPPTPPSPGPSASLAHSNNSRPIVKSIEEMLWDWLTTQQRDRSMEIMPLQMITVEETIAAWERFVAWMENSTYLSVPMFVIEQSRELIDLLRRTRL